MVFQLQALKIFTLNSDKSGTKINIGKYFWRKCYFNFKMGFSEEKLMKQNKYIFHENIYALQFYVIENQSAN